MLKLKLIVVHSSDPYKPILILPTFDVGLIRDVTITPTQRLDEGPSIMHVRRSSVVASRRDESSDSVYG